MKKTPDRYWIAFCVGINIENSKILASCLTFWASNRFYAMQAVQKMLPQHPHWLKSDGTTYPHQLYALEQCTPDEAEDRAFFYMQNFCDVAGVDPASGGLVA